MFLLNLQRFAPFLVCFQVCEIGDASKGSLSSYAYILMLLHYLQQQNVIPVLQTLYPDGQPPPEKNIEGWNCWFFEDLSKIVSVVCLPYTFRQTRVSQCLMLDSRVHWFSPCSWGRRFLQFSSSHKNQQS